MVRFSMIPKTSLALLLSAVCLHAAMTEDDEGGSWSGGKGHQGAEPGNFNEHSVRIPG